MTLDLAVAGAPALRARRLHLGDVAWVGIVLVTVLTAVSQSLCIAGAREAGILTFGWSCAAARRIITWRAGSAPPRDFPGLGLKPLAVIVLGVAPWMLLPVAQQIAHGWWLWQPMALPGWLRSAGAVLTLAGTVRLPRGASEGGSMSACVGECVDATGFALLAASPLIAVMAAAWVGNRFRALAQRSRV